MRKSPQPPGISLVRSFLGTSILLSLVWTGSAAEKPQLYLGAPPGIVIAESTNPQHVFLASPSLTRIPGGDLIVSHDWSGQKQPHSSVYRSKDNGQNWSHQSGIPNLHWATIFVHRGDLYLMGITKSFGDIVIHQSKDAGQTWSKPLSPQTGLLRRGEYHTAPVPVLVAKGRIWRAFERRPDKKKRREFTTFVLSAPEDSDLLDAKNWTATNEIAFDPRWLSVRTPEWIEGNVVVDPEGNILNILRTNTHPDKTGSPELKGGPNGLKRFEVAAAARVDDSGLYLKFDPRSDFRTLLGAQSKFTIRYDPISRKYWAIVSKITALHQGTSWKLSPHHQRNVLRLISSKDLHDWEENYTILSYRAGEPLTKENPIGFQYVDWIFDQDDLLMVSRTAWTTAPNYHDANLITFHRIRNFRSLTPEDSPSDLSNPKTKNPNEVAHTKLRGH